eukprot:3834487-Prymnesium_polylepis.1
MQLVAVSTSTGGTKDGHALVGRRGVSSHPTVAPRETFTAGRADGGRSGTPAVASSVVCAVRTDGHVGLHIV